MNMTRTAKQLLYTGLLAATLLMPTLPVHAEEQAAATASDPAGRIEQRTGGWHIEPEAAAGNDSEWRYVSVRR
jgi:invasion protein IalB